MKKILAAILILLFYWMETNAQNWEVLADLPEKLTFPVAAVVNGKIHIMGGGGTGGATMNHYQYDPATNQWTKKANVPYRAQQPAGIANGSDIHFFGGGFPNSGTPLKNHYIYDAVLDSWTQAADLTQARAIHYAVSLNGQVYSLAGQGVADWCEVYDKSSNSWSRKSNLPDTRFWYGAHIVHGGNIYRFCGGGYTAPVNLAHIYDPQTDQWTALPRVPVSIHGLGGAAIGDSIYLVGGYYDFEDKKDVWIYDINTQSFSLGNPLPVGRTYHNVVSLDNCIYSLGGNNAIDPTVGVSLLRYCPYQISSADNPASDYKPILQIEAESIVLNFKDADNTLWHFYLIDMSGKIISSHRFDTEKQKTYRIETISFASSFYKVILINEKQRHLYPVVYLK